MDSSVSSYYFIGTNLIDRKSYSSEAEKTFYESIISFVESTGSLLKSYPYVRREKLAEKYINENLEKMIIFAESTFPEGKKILHLDYLKQAIMHNSSPKYLEKIPIKKRVYKFGQYVIDRNNYESENEKIFNEKIISTFEDWIQEIRNLDRNSRVQAIINKYVKNYFYLKEFAEKIYPPGLQLTVPMNVIPYLEAEVLSEERDKIEILYRGFNNYINLKKDRLLFESEIQEKYFYLFYEKIANYSKYIQINGSQNIREDLEKLKDKGYFQDLENGMKSEYPEGLFILDVEIMALLVEMEQLENKKENYSPFEYKAEKITDDFLEERIPSTEIFGSKKYYYPRKKNISDKTVPSTYPSRSNVFCSEAPYLIPENEISTAKIRGLPISREVLVNPLLCTSQMPEEIQKKIRQSNRAEKRFFNLKDIDHRLEKDVTDFCSFEGETSRCIKYFEPVELAEISYKREAKKKYNYSIIPSIIVENYEGFVEEAATISKKYLENYNSLNQYIPFIIAKNKKVKIIGIDLSKKILPFSFQNILIFRQDEEWYVQISPEIIEKVKEKNKKFMLLPITQYYKGSNSSHALSLLIDNEAKTYEVFAPEGAELEDSIFYSKIVEVGQTLFPDYTQISRDTCPRVNFQSMSGYQTDIFCVIWNYFYLENYIGARENTPLEYFQEVSFQHVLRDELLRRGGRNYIYRTIISYLCYIINETFSTFSEMDSTIENLKKDFLKIPLYKNYIALLPAENN